jgi:D-alanyl-D-alanine carboxypeptidase/D-alanyl-D-alanine-endopeptidase (penicillin-binding protein 4)
MFRARHWFSASSVFVALCPPSWAQQNAPMLSYTSNAPLHQKLYDKKPAFYAYILGDVAGKRVDCHHAAQTYVTPASCQKIITALLAFRILGPQYRYKTQLFVSKKGGHINSARICFSGDPLLTSVQLETLLKPLEKKHIQGGIVLDCSGFQTPEYSNDWMIGDMGSNHSCPVSAANIDHNWIKVRIKRHANTTRCMVTNTEEIPIVATINVHKNPTTIKLWWNNHHLCASGYLNDSEPEKIYTRSPKTLTPYLLNKVQKVITKLGITGQIQLINRLNHQDCKKREALLSVVYSKKLVEVLGPAFKTSDNLVFDALYLTILHNSSPHAIVDWGCGDPIIKALLKKYFDLDMKGALFVDGSGLSRYNRIQPAQLWQVLKAGYGMPAFMHAFAHPGEKNSTLAKRTILPKGVRAKTGHLLGISTLCGYAWDGTKGPRSLPKAFVFVAQGYNGNRKEVQPIIDSFLKDQLENPITTTVNLIPNP